MSTERGSETMTRKLLDAKLKKIVLEALNESRVIKIDDLVNIAFKNHKSLIDVHRKELINEGLAELIMLLLKEMGIQKWK